MHKANRCLQKLNISELQTSGINSEIGTIYHVDSVCTTTGILVTGCGSVVKVYTSELTEVNKTTQCQVKGWVHWCMDWVQMNPHAPPWRHH